MYCSNCGNKIEDDAKFCSVCGHPVGMADAQRAAKNNAQMPDIASSIASMVNATVTSTDYKELGGWLAFITYGLLVAAVLAAISAVVEFFGFITLASYLGSWIVLFGIVELAFYGGVCYYAYHMYRMIKEKNPLFLRFYEMTMLIYGGINLVAFIIGSAYGYLSASDALSGIFGSVIMFFIWTTYFRKSVRVRTYFGTDEYLKQSIFFKNFQAPPPAA